MRPDLILHVVSKFVIPLIILFALYVQFHGDFGPGGGFQAGVIFSAAIILYAIVFGLEAAEKIIPERWLKRLAALGVVIYAGVGVVSIVKVGSSSEAPGRRHVLRTIEARDWSRLSKL